MVQIYNPNVVGKHISIDIKNVNSDKLKLVEDMKVFLDKIVEELKLDAVGECSHQFKKDNLPYGATMIYLLSESRGRIQVGVGEARLAQGKKNLCVSPRGWAAGPSRPSGP